MLGEAAPLSVLYKIARTLVATFPHMAEGSFSSRSFYTTHQPEPDLWYRLLLPPSTPDTLPGRSEWYLKFVELGGMSMALPPAGTFIAGDIDAREPQLRPYLQRCLEKGCYPQEEDPGNAAQAEAFLHGVRAALVATSPTQCSDLLQAFRQHLAPVVQARIFNPAEHLFPACTGFQRLHAAMAVDVHLPANFLILHDLFEQLRRDLAPELAGRIIAACMRPVLDAEAHHAILGALVASVAVQQGAMEQVKVLLDGYRDALDTAKRRALAAEDEDAMLIELYGAMPTVFAADLLCKMLAEVPGSAKAARFEQVARQTEEDLVRFANAFIIDLSRIILDGLQQHKHLLRQAAAHSPEKAEEVLNYWRNNFVYCDKTLSALRATVSRTD